MKTADRGTLLRALHSALAAADSLREDSKTLPTQKQTLYYAREWLAKFLLEEERLEHPIPFTERTQPVRERQTRGKK